MTRMTPALPIDRDRLVAALAAVAIQLAIGWALVTGLAVNLPRVVEQGLKLFVVGAPPPPPKVVLPPHRVASRRPEGAAAPPNLRSHASEVVAPVPVVVVPPPPPPVIAAPVAGTGADPSQGAADKPGPGTGAGGIGDGTGSGGFGDGDGNGGETPPRQVKGRIKDSDYPREAEELGVGGTVSVRYVVDVDGRVPDCRVTHSSGSRALDTATCDLIRKRFRFRPSLDAAGRPVRSQIVEDHRWDLEHVPAEPE